MIACPYNARYFNFKENHYWPNKNYPKRSHGVTESCNFCTHLLDEGKQPACVEACPTGALVWGTRGELLAEAKQRLADDPGKYENKVYGEKDAGGTSVLYLSHVPFDKLGLPELGSEPVPEFSENAAFVILPTLFIGAPLILGGAYYLTSKRAKEA